MARLLNLTALAATAFVVLGAGLAFGQTCSPSDFGKAVDSAGSTLRAFNLANAPKIQAKLAELGQKKGWPEAQREDKARDFLDDERLAALDDTANDLLVKIDTLGRPADGAAPDCAKLDELKTAGVELLAVMKAKSAHTLGKIDAELAKSGEPAKVAAAPVEPKQATQPAAKSPPIDKLPGGKAAAREKPVETPKKSVEKIPDDAAAAGRKPAPSSSWSTTAELDPAAARDPLPPPEARDFAPAPYDAGTAYSSGDEEGYTIDEIRDATQGFFGTVSTSLASVIEHAFRKSGRPTAYVLGTEGGGAFLAGLRYGSGTVYPRRGSPSKVYWHGPSLGFDVGAEGSRTLFLIYSLHDREALFRRFTGVDGSAYFVGGVGITFLKGGDVLMAPIRSGVGLRLGAGIGYIRFTPEASWNPF